MEFLVLNGFVLIYIGDKFFEYLNKGFWWYFFEGVELL